MNVMKIKHYLSGMAALAMMAACSDYDPGMSENAVDLTDAEIETIQEYTANFVERYGEIDPNHTWGFGELAEMEEMGTRQSYPNSNMWITVKRENNQPVGFEIPDGVKIPGFPVENYYLSSDYNASETAQYEGTQSAGNYQGKYHFIFTDRKDLGEQWFDSEEAIIQYMVDNNIGGEIIPLGDVARFNTLTDAEVADVYAEFSKEWHGTNPDIDLKAYYIQQIWHGNAKYPYWEQAKRTEAANNEVDYHTLEPSNYITGGDRMDYLVAYGENYNAGNAEHFYNFNNSNYQLGEPGMMLVMESSTKNFAYHDSQAEEMWWDHFRLVELHGNYYVGFDFESTMKGDTDFDKDIPRDYIYNDWIVKIIPGTGTIGEPDELVRTIKRRVMCEDLGSTFDFDFNDLVFDVEYTREEKKEDGNWVPKNSDGKWDATITLQAAGGTLPIFIKNFDGTAYNVHEYMGGTKSGDIYSPINVGTGLSLPAKALPTLSVSSTDPDNIVILVTSPDTKERGATNQLELPTIEGSKNFGTNYAPQKICVPATTRWTKEYQQIEWAYPYFHEWVNRENGDFGFDNPNDWTKKEINTTKLY